jgi:hypothetical protein
MHTDHYRSLVGSLTLLSIHHKTCHDTVHHVTSCLQSEEDAMTQPNELTATAAAKAIARGTMTSVELVQSCLDRIHAREADIGAWIHLDDDAALAQARACDQRPAQGLLHGVPVGIKDIIETYDMPTRYGSPIYAGHQSFGDAASVALLRAAGAVILGKTVTTEFAMYTPGKTANPHHPAHTPGGSSSGSAAAVADAMVPLALGTQTAGSIIRPASYCGAVGYKPTHGIFPIAGIKALDGFLSHHEIGVLRRQFCIAHLGTGFSKLLSRVFQSAMGIRSRFGPLWRAIQADTRGACRWGECCRRPNHRRTQ